MWRTHSIAKRAVAILFAGALAGHSALAQGAAASLTDQLKQSFKLAKMGSDSAGSSVVEGGTVLVIQKGGILGVPPASLAMAPSTFKDGELHAPNAILKMAVAKTSKLLTVGEKVYAVKLDVSPKSDKVTVTIVECDSCNGVTEASSYKSQVVFQFPKGYLDSADAGQIGDVIKQVLAPDTEADNQQQAQKGNGQQAQADPAAQAPLTIQLGQTINEVQSLLGPPQKIVNLGAKQIYVYKDLKITFLNGKVADVQ